MLALLSLAFAAPTLAVADLQNTTGLERMEPAGPGAAAILVTKFTSIQAIDVVERKRLEAVLAEIQLSQSGVVDPMHAVEAGRLLGADFLAFGSIIGFDAGELTVHLKVVDTESSRVLVADIVSGRLGEDGSGFFDLVNILGDRIVAALQVELSPEEERAFQTARMREVEALMRYGNAKEEARYEQLEAALARCGAGDADPRSKGAHRGVLAARVESRIDAATFDSCVDQVTAQLTEEAQTDFWSWMLKTAVRQVDAPVGFELRHQIATRPVGMQFAERRLKKATKQMGRSKASGASELLAILELDQGTWKGAPVTADTLSSAELLQLEWFAHRLPEASLRTAAAERLVRRRIAASPFEIVRNREEAVVQEVLETGSWAVPSDLVVTEATWEPERVPILTVAAKPSQAAAVLRLESSDGIARSALSMEALTAVVEGLEEPVGLCPPAQAFDPTPCLDPGRVVLDDARLAQRDTGIAIPTRVPIDDLVELLSAGDTLRPGVKVDGVPVSGLEIPLRLKPVPSLWMHGSNGSRGPDLTVEMYSIRHDRVLVGVRGAGRAWASAAVVPYDDTKFTVGSKGGQGVRGRDGRDGEPGAEGVPGYPGTCETNGGDGQDGGDGFPGTNGENGGPGGDGGFVQVLMHCEHDCAELESFARNRVSSVGGSGGPGGRGGVGGKGGAGGEGGDGARCELPDGDSTRTVSTWDGSDGSRGSDGPQGESGSRGPDGNPGAVEYVFAR